MSLLTCSLCIALPYWKLETLELSSGGFNVEWGLNLIYYYMIKLKFYIMATKHRWSKSHCIARRNRLCIFISQMHIQLLAPNGADYFS
jgi:hypothetical protein